MLQAVGGDAHDVFSGLDPAGEIDLADQRMSEERVANFGRSAGHDVHDSRWKKRAHELERQARCQRGLLRGFDHHGVARNQCLRKLGS